MPNCGYLEDYSITVEQSQFIVSLTPKGYIDVCSLIKGAFPEVKCVVRKRRISLSSEHTIAIIASSLEEKELEQFLDLLMDCLTIDTSLDECHALSPYTLVNDDGGFFRSEMGELVYKAKNQSNLAAANIIAARFIKFVGAHPRYAKAELVVAAPRSEREATTDLPSHLAKHVASSLGKTLLVAEKTRDTEPNKDLLQSGDEGIPKENVRNSIRVEIPVPNPTVLVLDDTCGSGGTLEELGRACRHSGAAEVLGLTVAKDATYMREE